MVIRSIGLLRETLNNSCRNPAITLNYFLILLIEQVSLGNPSHYAKTF